MNPCAQKTKTLVQILHEHETYNVQRFFQSYRTYINKNKISIKANACAQKPNC